MKDLYTTHGSGNFRDHGDLLVKGHTLDDAINYGEFLRDPANAGKSLEEALAAAKEAHADKYADPSLLINEAEILALSRYGSTYSKTAQFTSALTLAKSLLTDKAITSSLGSPISVSSLTGGYNLAFIRLLSAYGALGSNGEALATAVLGSDYSGYSNESAISSLLKSSSSDYLTYLSTLTGERTFKDEDISSSVLGIPLSQVNLVAGSTITLGQTGGTPSEVDVSSHLSKASSTSDRKVLVVGAAKDLKVAGDIRFKNSNNVEDHALVLGAADDVFINGTTRQATKEDVDAKLASEVGESITEASNIEYTGSNLGIGSGDTGKDSMYLVNANIQTGGNLAVGSLGTINITSANFSVGMANSSTSDPDNVYIYANELIDIDTLAFSGRVDDIYMESKTIHLKNTIFPATSEVMLRSQAGSLHIQNSSTDIKVGGVNFYQVTHQGISSSYLADSDFQGVNGHINSNSVMPNGIPYIRVRAQ
jgi:hypothetical protein